MYWWGLFHWSHGSTGSEDPCLLVPGRYYRSRGAVLPLRAVLPLPASGTTAWGGTTASGERYYRGSPRYYRDPNRTHTPSRFTLFISSGLLHLISRVLCCCFLGWSGGSSRQPLKRKAPGTGSSSVKKTAQKNKDKVPMVPIDVLPLPQYRTLRRVTPYREERDPSLFGTKFWNRRQQEIYHMLTKDRKNPFVPNVKSVSLQHMAAHPGYFQEATAIVDQFGLGPIISFNKDFSPDLLAQFFATVYFRSQSGVRSLIWMLGEHRVSCTWEQFMAALGVPFTSPDDATGSSGLRPHTAANARPKGDLAPFQISVPYTDAKGRQRTRLILTRFLDIMHRIFRTSLFPRVGNLDLVHGYLVNMLLLCEEHKGTTQTLDISNIMWEELYSAVMERKVPIYGPYLQVLFEMVWDDHFDPAQFPLPVGMLVKHGVVELRIKDKWSGVHGPSQSAAVGSDEEMAAEEEEPASGGGGAPRTRSGARFGGAPSSPSSVEQPGWAAKLTRKVKKFFCMQSHMQHNMYLEHKRAKENRQREKKFYRHMGMPFESGSEENITDEEQWIYQFSSWEIDEDTAGTSSSAPPATETVADDDEESEEGSSEEEDDDDDDVYADE